MQTDRVVSELEFALVGADPDPIVVAAHLRYDVHDPFAVCVSFDAGAADRIEWTFARELLERGLWQPAGEGDVHVSPKGARLVLSLCSPSGRAILETSRGPVAEFVTRTQRLVPAGHEAAFIDLDRELAALLS